MDQLWFSYDAIARDYASVAERIYFAAPAAELVRLLSGRARGRLLDVGTGTGVIAAAALQRGEMSAVSGCDASLSMLRLAQGRVPGASLSMVVLPGLPFRPRTFNAVTAGFVLSHIADVRLALAEIRAVLREDGCLGATSWAVSVGASAPGRLWDSLAQRFIPADVLQGAAKGALPAEATLSVPEGLARAVGEAGFTDVRVEQKTYAVAVPVGEFLQSRLISMSSRYMAAHLPEAEWSAFLASAEQSFRDTFGERVSVDTTVNFVTARAGK